MMRRSFEYGNRKWFGQLLQEAGGAIECQKVILVMLPVPDFFGLRCSHIVRVIHLLNNTPSHFEGNGILQKEVVVLSFRQIQAMIGIKFIEIVGKRNRLAN